jgi:hypothetical protein
MITTDVADIAYLDDEPRDEQPVILLHVFYDQTVTWDVVYVSCAFGVECSEPERDVAEKRRQPPQPRSRDREATAKLPTVTRWRRKS